MHPSVFATASSNGTLAFWNLASSIDEPVTGLDGIAVEKTADPSSSQRGVNKLKWSADGRRIAAACSDTLYVLGMSEDLWKPNGDEEVRLMSNLKGRGLLDEE
jgi:dynein intermediate chain